MGLLSLMRLHGEGLGREHWEPLKVCSDSFRIWASVSDEAPWRGPWEGALGTLEGMFR